MSESTGADDAGLLPGVVEIESLSSGGDGVARLPDGRVAFVAGGVPGDRVALELVEERKRFVRARIVDLIAPGPGRIEAPCPHFGTCGGCLWQHVAYDVQLDAKRRAVSDALRRIGGVLRARRHQQEFGRSARRRGQRDVAQRVFAGARAAGPDLHVLAGGCGVGRDVEAHVAQPALAVERVGVGDAGV